MEPKSEREILKQSACESARQMLKLVGFVIAGGVVLGGITWLMSLVNAQFPSLYKNQAEEMREGACALAWLFILVGNFVWLTCNRFTKMQGREPSGKYGYLLFSIMGLTFAAELLLTGIIVWMGVAASGIGNAEALIMVATTVALVVSVGIKMPDSGRG